MLQVQLFSDWMFCGIEKLFCVQLFVLFVWFSFLICYIVDVQIFLDGEALLDLPGMLQYLQTQSLKTPGTFTPGGNAATMERLDHEDSPAKGAISRIKNKLIREVSVLDNISW